MSDSSHDGGRLRPVLPRERFEALWEAFGEARRRREVRRTLRRAIAFSSLSAALVAVVVAVRMTRDPGPLTPPGGGVLAGVAGERLPDAAWPVALDDGSRIEALSDSPDLSVFANEARRFVTHLGRGHVRFSVTPGGPRQWVVETDLATVEVAGTVFELDRRDGALEVRVERGVVLVRGEQVPGRLARLTAGMALTVGSSAPPPAVPPVVEATTGSAAGTSSRDDSSGRPTPSKSPMTVSTAPKRGRSTAAGAPVPSGVPTLDDELDGLEAMRRAGRREEAREALRQRTSRSAVAAERFTLLMTLARWTSEEGDPLAAAGLLNDIDGRGVPPELLKAAWRLAAVNWRRAGRPEEADRVEVRLQDRFPEAAKREDGASREATP